MTAIYMSLYIGPRGCWEVAPVKGGEDVDFLGELQSIWPGPCCAMCWDLNPVPQKTGHPVFTVIGKLKRQNEGLLTKSTSTRSRSQKMNQWGKGKAFSSALLNKQ